jgi:DNA-binding protein H-NS
MADLEALERQLAELQEQVRIERDRVKDATLARVKEMLASGVIQPEELRALLPAAPRDRRHGPKPPKYRNPQTGDTWSGQGALPVWLRDLTLAERERFLIPNPNK